VFMIHGAGGSTLTYTDLARHVTFPHTLWAVGFPDGQLDRLTTIRALAASYVEVVRAVQPEGPYVLGGYSFGGSVAVEMTAILERAGQTVRHVLLLDSHPPEAYIGGQAEDGDFLAAFPALMAEILPDVRSVGQRPPRSIREAVEQIRPADWPPEAGAELERFFRIWQQNHAALKRWYPEVLVRSDVTVFAATAPENPVILDRLAIRPVDRGRWARHTKGSFSLVKVAGNHYSMLRDPGCLAALGVAYDQALSVLPGDRT
jgi:phthiocerol/phenolphthiocerol synthesis type-I polyketide synthase E